MNRRVAPPRTDVLIVEDDEQVIKLFKVYLREAGFRIAVARKGEAALDMAERMQPAVIVLDLLLPDLDGWEVLSALKASPVTRAVPVVIVSVLERQALGFRLGAVEHLVKPVERMELVLALERTLLRERFAGRIPRVLLMHDDDDDRENLALALRDQGYELVVTEGGAQGIARLRETRPDLAVMDLLFARGDCFDVIAELRRDPATAHIPVLIMARADLSRAQRQRLSGKIRAIVIQDEAPRRLLVETVSHFLLETRP